MLVGLFTILTVFVPLAFSQFCDSGYSDLNGGTPCDRNSYCQFHGGSAYQCLNGYCCKRNGFCSINEISIGGVCHRLSSENGPCIFTAQCQPSGLVCTNGFCRRGTPYQNPGCSNPKHQVERENSQVKNCLFNPCSIGFGCEFSSQWGQYVCCGNYNANTDYDYGRVRMYPGTSMPLQCFRKNQCLWNDTPNCVYSQRYQSNVCCSTFNC